MLTGRGAADLAVPPPPASGPCKLRKEGLAYVPTYERACVCTLAAGVVGRVFVCRGRS